MRKAIAISFFVALLGCKDHNLKLSDLLELPHHIFIHKATAVTSLVVPEKVHMLGTDVIGLCSDGVNVGPCDAEVDAAGNVTFTFETRFTGEVLILQRIQQ